MKAFFQALAILTRMEMVNFVRECLSSFESDLWYSLAGFLFFFSLLFPFVARQVLMTLMHRPRTERTCGTSIFISTSFHRPNNSMYPRPIPQTYCVHARSSRVNPTNVSEESFSDDDSRDYHEHVFTRLSELLCSGKRVTEISYTKIELTSSYR